MKLGIVTDIHEDVPKLALALQHFRQQGVEQVVVLGDVFDTGRRLRETVGLLAEAKAVGVWGNHDLGLCHEPEQSLRERYGGPVLDFMGTLRPRLELAGCLFTHGLPCWDATDPVVYYLGDRPETAKGQADSFAACDHAAIFIGHFHCWVAATLQGQLAWNGSAPMLLRVDHRYLITVAALCDGWCAVFDTDSQMFVPHRVAEAVEKPALS
jgi:hypothetical protein